MLDNREIAILVWLAVFLTWVVAKREIRDAAAGLFRAAFQARLAIYYSLVLGYVALIVAVLRQLGFWHLDNLKSTLLWLFTAAFVMAIQVGLARDTGAYLAKAVREGLKISVVLEFITNLYPVTLLIELLLVPIATILTCMLVIAESKEKYKPLRGPINAILALLGLALLAYAISEARTEFRRFTNLSTLVEFLLPIVLTILFVPFLLSAAAWMKYESVFTRLQFFIEDPDLRAFTKLQLVKRFGFNLRGVDHWWEHFIQVRPRTKAEIRRSLRDFESQSHPGLT